MDGLLRGPRGVAVVVAFLLELALLAGAAAWVLQALPDPWRWLAALAVVAAIGTVWGLLLAPRRRFEIGGGGRLALEALLFVGVGVGLAFTGLLIPAVIGVALWACNRVALAVLPTTKD